MTKNDHNRIAPVAELFEDSVVNSALWAAAGDALGWITELSFGSANVKRRSGTAIVTAPVAWKRVIGGRTGPKVDLPGGTYSDDTQLRLAVCRSIRGNGSFDVETFAKIELTVWPTYALGGGQGTKTASVSLSKRGINWFSNFYETKEQKYMHGGGNGAAMRVQPHVWSSNGNVKQLMLDVLRNAIVTHGHPQGFCGAIFHALTLFYVQSHQEIPPPDVWSTFVNQFGDIVDVIDQDPQLAAFWVSAWESNADASLTEAVDKTVADTYRDIDAILSLLDSPGPYAYKEALHRIGCLSPQFRGAGVKTALAALFLAYMYRDARIEDALVCAANELDSDTDTIATMVGALLGAIAHRAPAWDIQDKDYIVQEARRMAAIAQGKKEESFEYPDIGLWSPPASQMASIGKYGDGLAIAGLGELRPIGKEYISGEAVWQWFKLPYGQTILAKRKISITENIRATQLPRIASAENAFDHKQEPPRIPPPQISIPMDSGGQSIFAESKIESIDIDGATDEIIAANFDDATIGRIINRCIDSTQSVEAAIAIVAILAKAKLARQRRRR